MSRKLTGLLMLSCVVAAGGLNTIAQDKKPGAEGLKGPTDGTFKYIASKPASGPVVKGAPYSATATTDIVQTLGDGNQIIRKNQSAIYRDSEGRTRIEQTLETIGKWAADGEPRQTIFINDPVAGVSYNLNPQSRTAHKIFYAPHKPEAPVSHIPTEGPAAKQARASAYKEQAGEKPPPPGDRAGGRKEIARADGGRKEVGRADGRWIKEVVGRETLEGVGVEHTRATLTIPAGEIGNTRPIEVVDESWYSHELQLLVMSRRRDPRSGETVYRLTNLNRGEPDRSLFEVPADYAVEQGKAPAKAKPAKEQKPAKEPKPTKAMKPMKEAKPPKAIKPMKEAKPAKEKS